MMTSLEETDDFMEEPEIGAVPLEGVRGYSAEPKLEPCFEILKFQNQSRCNPAHLTRGSLQPRSGCPPMQAVTPMLAVTHGTKTEP